MKSGPQPTLVAMNRLMFPIAWVCVVASCTPAPPSPAATTAAPSTPAPGWRLAPNDTLWGTNHAHIHVRGHGYGSDVSAVQLRELRGTGATFVALTLFAFQRTSTADSLVGYGPEGKSATLFRDRSLTDDDVRREVNNAHAVGLRVALKPHLWAGDFGSGEWHGTIRQNSAAEHARWWQSYRAFVLSQAALAQSAGVEMLVLGTELVRMTTSPEATQQAALDAEWRALIRDVRAVYAGSLSYAAHWDQEAFALPFWDALDVIGVSAYFPLQAPDDAPVDDLVAAWAPHQAKLATLAAAHPEKPLVFLELGFRAVRGSHRAPWSLDAGVVDDAAQARAYEATARVFADKPWWRGALLWKSFTDPSLADERGDGRSYSFLDRPSRAVVEAWFRR
jgi:hypothetical protein